MGGDSYGSKTPRYAGLGTMTNRKTGETLELDSDDPRAKAVLKALGGEEGIEFWRWENDLYRRFEERSTIKYPETLEDSLERLQRTKDIEQHGEKPSRVRRPYGRQRYFDPLYEYPNVAASSNEALMRILQQLA